MCVCVCECVCVCVCVCVVPASLHTQCSCWFLGSLHTPFDLDTSLFSRDIRNTETRVCFLHAVPVKSVSSKLSPEITKSLNSVSLAIAKSKSLLNLSLK